MAMLTFGHLMEKIYKLNLLMNARLCVMYSLVFFLLAIAPACRNHGTKLGLVWKDSQATAIAIPDDLIRDASLLGVQHSVRVVRAGSKSKQGIFGNFSIDGHMVNFQPLIPLSPGLSYEIWQDEKLIGTLSIPLNKGEAPKLLTIYPEQDTMPENLLKFYFHFSHTMRTGQVLEHIYLLDKNKDTMQRVFLNLQPELWDKTGTVLTLWLDPGRIKRDLVLNKELGNPLKKAQTYQLVIDSNWKDTRGIKLGKTYSKHFTVGERDGEIPDINKWALTIPKAGSHNPLIIQTGEALDHYLLNESITVLNDNGETIKGNIHTEGRDKLWLFAPDAAWEHGNYRLQVKANLEDQAGNNLNRVFDRDIRKDKQQNKEFFERVFVVK
jgi:hypothetical protein